jgi:hypothetical protein
VVWHVEDGYGWGVGGLDGEQLFCKLTSGHPVRGARECKQSAGGDLGLHGSR